MGIRHIMPASPKGARIHIMMITTELNGQDGVCSVVDAQYFSKLMGRYGNMKKDQRIARFRGRADWVNQNVVRKHDTHTGLNGSLEVLSPANAEQLRLGWATDVNQDVASAMRSLILLDLCSNRDGRYMARVRQEPIAEPVLETCPHLPESGWCMQATLGEPVWDFIESEDFPLLLPEINERLAKFWGRLRGRDMSGQYATLFDGLHGRTLQISYPEVNMSLFAGSRQFSPGAICQFVSDAPDSSQTAFAQVFGLCVVLDYCRQELGKEQQLVG